MNAFERYKNARNEIAQRREDRLAEVLAENERLRSQLVKARAALERIEQIGLRAPTFSAAIQPGNIAHAALIELSLPDDQVASEQK